MTEQIEAARKAFQTAMVEAAKARGGAGATFIANGHSNLWLDIAYDAAARLAQPTASKGETPARI